MGNAIVFMPLFALAVMSLYLVLVFACHYFMTLVECTAMGQRTIQWPEEAFYEWLKKPLHLGWLAALYLFPAVVLSAGIGSVYAATALVTVSLALLFPIGALSAFIADSVWMPFHPKAIQLLFSKPGTTLGFYFLAITACVAGIGGFFLALFSKEIGWAGNVLGSILMALAWFVYACALGRLLFALTYTAPPPRKKRKRKKQGAPLPEPVEPVPAPLRQAPAWDPDFDDTPYEAKEAEVVTKEVHADIAKPEESEMKLLERTPVAPPPANPFGPDAFAPMSQNETMRNALILAVMFALQSSLVRLLIDMNPAK